MVFEFGLISLLWHEIDQELIWDGDIGEYGLMHYNELHEELPRVAVMLLGFPQSLSSSKTHFAVGEVGDR